MNVLCFLKQVAARWTVPGISLQMHLLIFPLCRLAGKLVHFLSCEWHVTAARGTACIRLLKVVIVFY